MKYNITNDCISQSESSSEDDYLTSEEEEEENKGDEHEEQEEDNNTSETSETSESQQSSGVDETSLPFENEQSNDDTSFDVHTDQTLIQIRVLIKRVRKLICVIRRSSILIEYVRQEKKNQRITW